MVKLILFYGNVFLITAVAVNAQDIYGLTNVVTTNTASITMAARNDGVYGDVVADSGIFHVRTDFDDFADKFVAYDTGIRSEGVFAVINTYVGAADAGCFDLE